MLLEMSALNGQGLQPREDLLPADGAGLSRNFAALTLCLALAAISLAASLALGVGLAERFNIVAIAGLAVWLLLMALIVRGVAAPPRSWALLGAVAVFSLSLRLWSAVLTLGTDLGADPMNYANLALSVIDGQGLITDDWFYGKDLRAYFPPFYPLVLAAFWKLFGVSAFSTLVMNTLIDAAAAWSLGDAARRMGHPAIGRAAALAYLAWPAFALSAGIPQKESLTLLLIILMLRETAIWLAEKPVMARRWRHGLWLGLWWGMLCLTQPSLALAPGAIALVLVWQRGLLPVVRLGLTALPTLLAVLAPWWLRNWMLFGAFVPFTTASGMMLNSAWRELRVPFPPGLFDLPEPERSAVMGKLARQAILDNPVAFFGQALKSLALGFAYEEASLARFRHTSPPISAVDHARLEGLLQGSYVAMLLSALGGAWRHFRQARVDAVTVYALALLISIGVTNIWFEFGERHRLIMTPFLLLIAASFWFGLRGGTGPREDAADRLSTS